MNMRDPFLEFNIYSIIFRFAQYSINYDLFKIYFNFVLKIPRNMHWVIILKNCVVLDGLNFETTIY